MSQKVAPPTLDRDFRQGGEDYVPSLPIIDSGMCVLLMERLHTQRAAGLLTPEEWRAEQREILDRTVPGFTRDMYESAYASLLADETAVVKDRDALLDALMAVR